MDSATSGNVIVDGKRIDKLTNRQLIKYRREDIGFVFQFYNLIQNLTAIENVELATQICKDSLDPKTVLEKVGLKDRIKNFPSQLSGGEQQRVAIGRALITQPKLILADEPTGNLDSKNSQDVMDMLTKASRHYQQTILIITHNKSLITSVDRVFQVIDGVLTDLGGTTNETLS